MSHVSHQPPHISPVQLSDAEVLERNVQVLPLGYTRCCTRRLLHCILLLFFCPSVAAVAQLKV